MCYFTTVIFKLTDIFFPFFLFKKNNTDRFIRKQTLENGATGNVAFDDNGDRINAEYDIINVQNQTQISVGQYHYSNVSINDNFLTFWNSKYCC
jgi:hypothetical protein